MKIIRDYERYIEDDNVGKRGSKKSSFRKMKKESFYDSEKQSDKKGRERRK